MPGPIVRFLIEALFLVLVAVGAGLARLSALAIVGVMLAAWVVVAFIERAIAGDLSRRAAQLRAAEERRAEEPAPSHVHVIGEEAPREPVPVVVAAPVVAAEPTLPPIAPAPVSAELAPPPPREPPTPAPVPAEAAPFESPPPPPVVEEPSPREEPPGPPVEPAPVAAEPPRLEVVPPPEPTPPPPPPPPEPEPQVVPLVPSGPREWNLWELERIARERAGHDVIRDEELSFLLMYLREFAAPDGALPADFDGLVRETFGSLLAAPR